MRERLIPLVLLFFIVRTIHDKVLFIYHVFCVFLYDISAILGVYTYSETEL